MTMRATRTLSGLVLTVALVALAEAKWNCRYGMFVADNGGPWFISGAPDPRWSNDDLHLLGDIHGSDFEAVDESGLMVDPDSGRVQVP